MPRVRGRGRKKKRSILDDFDWYVDQKPEPQEEVKTLNLLASQYHSAKFLEDIGRGSSKKVSLLYEEIRDIFRTIVSSCGFEYTKRHDEFLDVILERYSPTLNREFDDALLHNARINGLMPKVEDDGWNDDSMNPPD